MDRFITEIPEIKESLPFEISLPSIRNSMLFAGGNNFSIATAPISPLIAALLDSFTDFSFFR